MLLEIDVKIIQFVFGILMLPSVKIYHVLIDQLMSVNYMEGICFVFIIKERLNVKQWIIVICYQMIQ